jgi:hypothetical protein
MAVPASLIILGITATFGITLALVLGVLFALRSLRNRHITDNMGLFCMLPMTYLYLGWFLYFTIFTHLVRLLYGWSNKLTNGALILTILTIFVPLFLLLVAMGVSLIIIHFKRLHIANKVIDNNLMTSIYLWLLYLDLIFISIYALIKVGIFGFFFIVFLSDRLFFPWLPDLIFLLLFLTIAVMHAVRHHTGKQETYKHTAPHICLWFLLCNFVLSHVAILYPIIIQKWSLEPHAYFVVLADKISDLRFHTTQSSIVLGAFLGIVVVCLVRRLRGG